MLIFRVMQENEVQLEILGQRERRYAVANWFNPLPIFDVG